MGAITEAIEWDGDDFEHALLRAAQGVIEAPGVRLSSDQLRRLLDAGPRRADDRGPQLKSLNCRGAVLNGTADLRFLTCDGNANFDGATFSREARFNHARFLGDADFTGASFRADAVFDDATFGGDANFNGATFAAGAGFNQTGFHAASLFAEAKFHGPVGCSGATFDRHASFRGAAFDGKTQFDEAAFAGAADFSAATFTGDLKFELATFGQSADFVDTTFRGRVARFDRATFSGDGNFYGATFGGFVSFADATFSGDGDFNGATFLRAIDFAEVTGEQSVDFGRARFATATELGPIHIFDRLWLDNAVFDQRVRIEASALRASFARTIFRAGADVLLRWAEVWFEDTDFALPSLVAGLQARFTRDGATAFLGWEQPERDGTWSRSTDRPPEQFDPQVLSLRGARLAGLSLSGVDLRRCRFGGAHGLDRLRLERAGFPRPPEGWRRIRWGPVRWTRRRTIAEENHWRAEQHHGSGWIHADTEASNRRPSAKEKGSSFPPRPWPPEQPLALEPERIAALYRELRKGSEDSKDEPGANDFYYGEMEMRRFASHSRAERLLLTSYWLASGYALRAWRALVFLAMVLLLATVIFTTVGFDRSPLRVIRAAAVTRSGHFRYATTTTPAPSHSTWTAFNFSIDTATSLLRTAPSHPLTPTGVITEIALRLAGPLLLGLALVSLRGRVKR